MSPDQLWDWKALHLYSVCLHYHWKSSFYYIKCEAEVYARLWGEVNWGFIWLCLCCDLMAGTLCFFVVAGSFIYIFIYLCLYFSSFYKWLEIHQKQRVCLPLCADGAEVLWLVFPLFNRYDSQQLKALLSMEHCCCPFDATISLNVTISVCLFADHTSPSRDVSRN